MDINLLEKISDEEYAMLSMWRDGYGWDEDENSDCQTVDVKQVLANSWAIHNKDLYRLLGGNLIVTKQFTYEKSHDQLVDELENMIDGRGRYGRVDREGWRFSRNFIDWYRSTFIPPDAEWNDDSCRYEYEDEETEIRAREIIKIRDGLAQLVSYWTLAENKYDGESFVVELKDGKRYTVSPGCKPMKALAKIAEAYNIEGFEDFRICHSLVHNQRKIVGDISLSIHPLDYWTMSDNTNGWDSCMSWENYGGYRQGTVEMMNSPAVVVAYMSSKEQMPIGDLKWNNKKWRQLFIVDKKVILGIKSYPYYNDPLTVEITKWLKELAETNMGWQYFGDVGDEPMQYRFEPFYNPDHMDDSYRIKFNFYSNNMYTDVGCLEWHPMYVSKDIHENGDIEGSYKTNACGTPLIQFDYNYSGESQCVSCGLVNPPLSSESCLCCEGCQVTHRCDECGYHVGDDYYYLDGYRLCDECWGEKVRECIHCEEPHFKDDMIRVFVRIPLSKEYQNKLFEDGYDEPKEGEEIHGVLSEPVYLCGYHKDQFCERGLKNNDYIHKCLMRHEFGEQYYIDASNILVDEYDWEEYLPWTFANKLEEAQITGDYDGLATQFCYHINFKHCKELPRD